MWEAAICHKSHINVMTAYVPPSLVERSASPEHGEEAGEKAPLLSEAQHHEESPPRQPPSTASQPQPLSSSRPLYNAQVQTDLGLQVAWGIAAWDMGYIIHSYVTWPHG